LVARITTRPSLALNFAYQNFDRSSRVARPLFGFLFYPLNYGGRLVSHDLALRPPFNVEDRQV